MMRKATMKVLVCALMICMLMGGLPSRVIPSQAALPETSYLGEVTAIDATSSTLTIQTNSYWDSATWTPCEGTLESEALIEDALDEIEVGDYVEARCTGTYGQCWSYVALGRIQSETQGFITDIYGHLGSLVSDMPGDYEIGYENTPDCSKCGGALCEAEYTVVTVIRQGSDLESQQLYPGEGFVYAQDYWIDVVFNSGSTPAYPECTDEPIPGPQAFSDFTVHILDTAPYTATIQGRVVDASTDGNLSGAVVAMDSYSTTTNVDGSFSLSVPYDDYQISVSHTGYIRSVKPLSVYGNMSALFELVPECVSGPLEISGWIPHYDYDNDVDDRPGYPANPNAWDGLQSFTSNTCRFEMINPVWYFLSETAPGDIIPADDPSFLDSNTEVDDEITLNAAEAASVRVIPTIKTHTDSGTPVKDMLDGHGQEHAQALVDLVAAHGYDGIEIDYEGITLTHEISFSQFVSNLYTQMPEGKILIVTIPAQTDDYADSAYDYEHLGKHADLIKIMAYDDQWQSPITTHPRHHATLGWVENVIDYAIGSGGIPAEKLILGVPTYGYRWGQESGDDHWHKVGGATYEYATALSEDEGVTPTRTDVSAGAIPYFTYTSGITTYLQYYEDTTSTARKLELASGKGLRGVSFWRLGREDRGIWLIISALNAQPSDRTVIAMETGTTSSENWNIIQWLVDQVSRLVITLSWDQGIASSAVGVSETLHSTSSNCAMTVEVYRPSGALLGTFEVTEPIEAIIIDGAEAGTWESSVGTTCTEEQDYAIAVSGTTSTVYLPVVLHSH